MDEEAKQLLREIRDIGLRNESMIRKDVTFRRRVLFTILILAIAALAGMGHVLRTLNSMAEQPVQVDRR
jgi:hypothetical protein